MSAWKLLSMLIFGKWILIGMGKFSRAPRRLNVTREAVNFLLN